MDLVRAKGMFSFYEDGHQECCRVRKVKGRLQSCASMCGAGGNGSFEHVSWVEGLRSCVPAGARSVPYPAS